MGVIANLTGTVVVGTLSAIGGFVVAKKILSWRSLAKSQNRSVTA